MKVNKMTNNKTSNEKQRSTNKQHITIEPRRNFITLFIIKIKKIMKKLNLLIAIFLVVIASTSTSCEKIETEMRSYSFSVSRNNSPLSNSRVSIATENQDYSVETDNEGNCQINIPNTVALPEYVIATIDHNGIRPYALSVSGAINAKSNIPMNCQNVPSRVLVKQVALHHLGDDIYNGSENSQLQLPAEGSEKSLTFTLTSIPGSMPRLRIYTRGVQRTGQIQINGRIVGTLNESALNGDLSLWDFQLNAAGSSLSQIFRIGNNVLKIKPGLSGGSDTWDDIEFCALLLYYK